MGVTFDDQLRPWESKNRLSYFFVKYDKRNINTEIKCKRMQRNSRQNFKVTFYFPKNEILGNVSGTIGLGPLLSSNDK